MGLTLVGLTTLQRGIELAETGVNVQSFACRYYPQFKDKRNNFQGQVISFAIPTKPTRTVTMQADFLTGGTGIMATAFATAIVFANDVDTFGTSNTGGFYLDEITETQTADGWRSEDGQWTSDPLVA